MRIVKSGIVGLALLGMMICPSLHAAQNQQPLAVWDFEFNENLIWVKVNVGSGAPLLFILDSASTSHVIDSGVAHRLDLAESEEKILVRRTDSFEERHTTLPINLNIGNVRLAQAPLLILPLKELTSGRRKIDGILGLPLFENFRVQIDYKASKIRLFSRKSPQNVNGAIAMQLRSNDGVVGMNLRNSSGQEGMFVLDTGCSQGIVVSSHATSHFRTPEHSFSRTLCAGGEIPARCCKETSWTVGTKMIHRLETLFCKQASDGLLADAQWSGLVGNRFLSNFTVTFDWSARQVFLQPAG